MQRQLMILEVSRKQAYIFDPRVLRENRKRSAQIDYVTSSAFFERCCPESYDSHKNMVYSGGGHTVLQFDDAEQATQFARTISEYVLRNFPDMELFIKQHPYDDALTPGENLNQLSKALEQKKSRRAASFRLLNMGFEKAGNFPEPPVPYKEVPIPAGWELTDDTDEITGKEDNFLAVIHIDGNSMGKRVQTIYDSNKTDWSACVEKLRQFSSQIDQHFAKAYDEMAADLAKALGKDWPTRKLPLRKIIGAGDDICFVTAGSLGLECAASYMKHLSEKVNQADGMAYTACAGVVLIHKKFPFRRGYDLSEELCSSAKRFVAENGGDFCAMDYHIEFGQMKASLSQIRQDYQTEDGGRMELRPVAVTGAVRPERQYEFLAALIGQMKNNAEGIARSKIKALRTAFRQGEVESKFAMRMTQAEDVLYRGLNERFPDLYRRLVGGEKVVKEAFFDDNGVRRCLFFDAIELSDNTTLWGHQEVK